MLSTAKLPFLPAVVPISLSSLFFFFYEIGCPTVGARKTKPMAPWPLTPSLRGQRVFPGNPPFRTGGSLVAPPVRFCHVTPGANMPFFTNPLPTPPRNFRLRHATTFQQPLFFRVTGFSSRLVLHFAFFFFPQPTQYSHYHKGNLLFLVPPPLDFPIWSNTCSNLFLFPHPKFVGFQSKV